VVAWAAGDPLRPGCVAVGPRLPRRLRLDVLSNIEPAHQLPAMGRRALSEGGGGGAACHVGVLRFKEEQVAVRERAGVFSRLLWRSLKDVP
jgi:hypothetical protein